MRTPLDAKDLHNLGVAGRLLENPGLTARMTELIDVPIEKGLNMPRQLAWPALPEWSC